MLKPQTPVFQDTYLEIRSFKQVIDGASDKEPTYQCRRHKRHRINLWVGKIPWRRAQQPTIVFFLGESHGQRSLAGYSLQGHKQVDMTEVISTLSFRLKMMLLEWTSIQSDWFLYKTRKRRHQGHVCIQQRPQNKTQNNDLCKDTG